MPLRRLWLTDFRNHQSTEVSFDDDITVVLGLNGQGKTNLLEGIAWFARGSSFRGVPNEALIRVGATSAILRMELVNGERSNFLEVELNKTGRNRLQINGQRVSRTREITSLFTATIFGPDDLSLVKGGPNERRNYLDDVLVDLEPPFHPIRVEMERVLRQRNALLRQARGQLSSKVRDSLDVWDFKLVDTGEKISKGRHHLVEKLSPVMDDILGQLSNGSSSASLTYKPSWVEESLSTALRKSRQNDLQRGVTTIGPHRDEMSVLLNGFGARHFSSQGEQRALALAMRLSAHKVVAESTGIQPIVLLDDIFSELDDERSAALVELLPMTQAVLTTAGSLPLGVKTANQYEISSGCVEQK